MEPKDARRLVDGNLVMVNNPGYHPKLNGVILRVTYNNLSQDGRRCIGLEHINQIPNTYYESYSQRDEYIDPIPLATEWLERFGFKKSREDGWVWMLDLPKNDATYHSNCKYVHQLQNLYAALTGKELTVKEDWPLPTLDQLRLNGKFPE